jgi:uncharacterized integral membrane protein
MSAPTQTPEQTQERAPQRTRREQARTAAQIVLAVLITLFAAFNLKEVRVNWIVGSGHAPLIIVIAISLLVGVLLARFAHARASKRR